VTTKLQLINIMLYNSSHLRTNSINFSSISEDNQAGLIASNHSKRSADDVITAHMIRIEHFGPVTSRQTFWLGGRRRNGTETWRRRSCQCEHLRLTTHEKSLLNGDVPWRNGNVTYSVNRPLSTAYRRTCDAVLSTTRPFGTWGPFWEYILQGLQLHLWDIPLHGRIKLASVLRRPTSFRLKSQRLVERVWGISLDSGAN